ncbi:MAG: tRNA-guanine transglycosylase DpdA [Phycisphaerales bacterium]|nr:hypothetical protein [Planctomycetota bacterium]
MRKLLVLGCSSTKRDTHNKLPAVDLYDGPFYRVLRTFLRDHLWPQDLSVAVLSAEYGLMGGLTHIQTYDRVMTKERAVQLSGDVRHTLLGWRDCHSSIQLVLGETYLGAIQPAANELWRRSVDLAAGPIGMKLQYLHNALHRGAKKAPRCRDDVPSADGRPMYFLPDWDDFVDTNFDFVRDKFSCSARADRDETHCSALVKPKRLADGILVSLAQSFGGKGLLRALQASSPDSLAPKPVKRHFGLADDQWAFGDCGAFSYVNEESPTISVEQAVATYELYGFDLGASVDHIPVPEVVRKGKRVTLTDAERRKRVALTRSNAQDFLDLWRRRECRFNPVGIVQALSPRQFASSVAEYAEMGYRRIALGGLVPRSDDEILAIVTAVCKKMSSLRQRPWLHLMGIYRPNLQAAFRRLRVDSFDSATYFRKAWLRSDQNYLGATGNWYAAIRVPPSHDPRTAKRLASTGVSLSKIQRLEAAALQALRAYAGRRIGIERCLKCVLHYDLLLPRGETDAKSMEEAYRRTLSDRPWELCECPICKKVGIDVLIFRGLNRNKRRGAHNTLMLYNTIAR